MMKSHSSNWDMAIDIYMFHLNMTREEACEALGIRTKNTEVERLKKNKKKESNFRR